MVIFEVAYFKILAYLSILVVGDPLVNSPKNSLTTKIQQQFDSSPYPRIPIELSPKENASNLYVHNFLTPFYIRNQQIIDPQSITILDVGCGSGFKTLVLAEANPGATIVGIDLSEKSVELARARLQFHGFTHVQFHAMPIRQVSRLNMKFDYINCDEVLYLMPDLAKTLKTLKSVLKPTGIIRGNLHSLYQRYHFFRAQELFTIMGLMQGNPEETEINVALDTMKALKDGVPLKQQTWNPAQAAERPQEYTLMNYLFQGDQGYTIPDLFDALRGANLEFICMVDQRSWDLLSLFQDPQNLPALWQVSLPRLSMEDRLQIFELIAPIHRLLDFWCGWIGETPDWQVPQSWQPEEWENVQVHLHPQLQTAIVQADLIEAIRQQRSFDISHHLSAAVPAQINLSPYVAACLVPLWDAPQPFSALVQRLLRVRSCDPITLEPTSPQQAMQDLREVVMMLELHLYVLLKRN
jgi:SAM-dependent methyltransferase